MRPEIEEIFLQVKKHIDDDLGGKGDYESVLVLYELANTAAKKERDKEGGKEVARYARQVIEEVIAPGCATETERVREAWRIVDRVRDADMIVPETELYKNILLFLAQNKDFDSYLLYLEYKRQEKDRFYLPKRRHFIRHGIIQALQDMVDDKLDIFTLSMPPGTQKAQPLYSKVLTPSGFITMGEVKVGTVVMSGTGKPCNVTGVYPQGVKPIYELTFDDGSKCRCSDEHLWTVQTRDDRKRKNKDGSEKYRTIPLKDMLKNYKVEGGKRCNYSIDYVPEIDFEEKELKLHPYVLGALIGDGGFASANIEFSNPDVEVLNRVANLLPEGYRLRHQSNYDYRVVGKEGNYRYARSIVKVYLEEYGLLGKRSHEKFIPKDYLYANYENRLELLRGLLDTDGYATAGYAEYATTSPQLADDVCELVHSLGGFCSVSKQKAGYKKDGVYVPCKDCYSLIIEFPKAKADIFYLRRYTECL